VARGAALALALLVGAALPAWAAHHGDGDGDRGRPAREEKPGRDARWAEPFTPRGYTAPPPVFYNEPGLSFDFPLH
jgi:hypothetical protein